MENRKRVLIADDEPGVRDLIATALESDNFDIFTAADGREALTMSIELRPEVVLLDIMMPYMDGIEVCQRLKSNPATAGAVVIILTGRTVEADRKRLFDAGASQYISKPFSPLALIDKVNQLLSLD